MLLPFLRFHHSQWLRTPPPSVAGKEMRTAFKASELNISGIERLQDDMADLMVRSLYAPFTKLLTSNPNTSTKLNTLPPKFSLHLMTALDFAIYFCFIPTIRANHSIVTDLIAKGYVLMLPKVLVIYHCMKTMKTIHPVVIMSIAS